jgi:hypothetical protein
MCRSLCFMFGYDKRFMMGTICKIEEQAAHVKAVRLVHVVRASLRGLKVSVVDAGRRCGRRW